MQLKKCSRQLQVRKTQNSGPLNNLGELLLKRPSTLSSWSVKCRVILKMTAIDFYNIYGAPCNLHVSCSYDHQAIFFASIFPVNFVAESDRYLTRKSGSGILILVWSAQTGFFRHAAQFRSINCWYLKWSYYAGWFTFHIFCPQE